MVRDFFNRFIVYKFSILNSSQSPLSTISPVSSFTHSIFIDVLKCRHPLSVQPESIDFDHWSAGKRLERFPESFKGRREHTLGEISVWTGPGSNNTDSWTALIQDTCYPDTGNMGAIIQIAFVAIICTQSLTAFYTRRA